MTKPLFDPYVPPAAPPEARARAERPPAGWLLKWIYLFSSASLAGTFVLAGLAGRFEVVRAIASAVNPALNYTSVCLSHVAALAWLYKAWCDVPPLRRHGTSPFSAAAKLVIPIYGHVWAFQVNARLCAGLDARRRALGPSSPAPRALAFGAAGLQVGESVLAVWERLSTPSSYLLHWGVTIGAHVLWFAYMLECDAIRGFIAGGGPGRERGESAA